MGRIIKLNTIITLFVWLLPVQLSAQSDVDLVYKSFQDPPKEYTAVPFWSWNGTLEPEKLEWQVKEMVDKGIYGAFMHARAGINYSETPYFSEGWWKAVETVVKKGKETGFFPYLYDEDKWPSGSAGGRTRAADSIANSKKALRFRIIKVEGPCKVDLSIDGGVKGLIAVQPTSKWDVNPETLTDITGRLGESWDVPEGNWQIWVFTQHIEENGVNYLRKETVRTFMDITHEEYYRRFGEYFGSVIPGLFFDEISAGPHDSELVWTDDFFEQFRKIKGYDLRRYLPVLFRDAGKETPRIRCDYYDVYTRLYVDSWFRQIGEWCGDRRIFYTGHTHEDVNSYISQGNYFLTWGPVQVPGTDNEDFRYTFPRKIGWFKPKQISGIAHTTGKNRIMGEILGGAGWGITLEELRYGVGMLGAYGLNLFVPHLFHYSMDNPRSMDDWPNSWFYRNPYWKYFKSLADYMRRVSFLGSQGKHVCDIAVLFPITSQWASGITAHRSELHPGGGSFSGKLQSEYISALEILLRNQWDFDVLEPEYFAESTIDDKQLFVGDGSYHVLILPPLTTIRYDVLDKLREFFLQGGIVIAIGQLPTDSWEGGKNDPNVLKTMWEIFRVNPRTIRSGYDETEPDLSTDYIINSYPSAQVSLKKEDRNIGIAYFTKKIYSIPDIVRSHIAPPDVKVSEGDRNAFTFLHRRIDQIDVYNIMNSHKKRRSFTVIFRTAGKPEIWDPVTGDRKVHYNFSPVGYDRTMVRLDMQPWENIYVVFRPQKEIADETRGLIRRSTMKDSKILSVDQTGVTVEGWVSGDADRWRVDGNFGTRRFDGEGYVNRMPPVQELEEPWEFLMVPKDLNYRWGIDIKEQAVELPVMDFRVERRAYEGNNRGWASYMKNTTGWKQVKIFDSLYPEEGCRRYASLWDAHWITYYDCRQFPGDLGMGNDKLLHFMKKFSISSPTARGWITAAGDDLYEVYLNGILQGTGRGWNAAETFDITPSLHPGTNTIEVTVRMGEEESSLSGVSDNPQGAVLFQGEIHGGSGEKIRIFTDNSWQVSMDNVNWRPAFELTAPPMGMYGNTWLSGQRLSYPAVLWYRQVLPPGAVKIFSPDIGGDYELYINGKLVPLPSSLPLSIKHLCSRKQNIIAIKVLAQSGRDGIRRPLKIGVEPADVPLKDWSTMGIGWYSGKALYSTKCILPEENDTVGLKWILDLGTVNHFAEVWINGELVDALPWHPFTVDVTDYLHKGENSVSVVVANLLANEMRWNIFDDAVTWQRSRWWHDGSILRESEKLASGLLGPVRLIPYQRIEVSAPFSN